MNLSVFLDQNLFKAGTDLFRGLNISLNSNTAISLDLKDVLKEYFKAKDIFSDVTETYFLGLVDDTVFDKLQTPLSLEEAENKINNNYNGLMVFAVRLNDNKQPARSDIADLTRAFNRASKFMPVVLLVQYGNLLAFSTSERMKYQQTWRPGEKIGKVSMLKDIDILKTHAGHSRILEDLIVKSEIKNFKGLYEQWKQVFSIQILNKRFYQEISNWYFWASAHVSFPDDIEKDKNIRNATSLIRLITRIIFIWFIKEKQLVPEMLFDPGQLGCILKEFAKNKESHSFYQAVLQNLFFGTLNQKMDERGFAREGSFTDNKKNYGVKNLFRYADQFAVSSEEAIALFKDIPFLNGGLFDCLDKENDEGKVLYADGFSRNPKKRATVPDFLFFNAEEECDLNAIYGTENKKYKVKGLFNILSGYKFTITENTPIEEEIALDPELLGKVFENLLASYNPETQTTARKQTGSFYTPREIVNYMVDESVKSYLKQKVEQTFLSVPVLKQKAGQTFLSVPVLKQKAGQTFLSVPVHRGQTGQTEMSDLPLSKIKITRRHLPHWQMTGAFYFITFRTAVKTVLSENEQKIVHEHIIGGNKKFYHLICSVIMPDHVHLILKPNQGYDLSRIMKGIKGVSSNKINKAKNSKGTVWQDESFDRIIRDENELIEKIQYMYNNPIKQGLTKNTLNYFGCFLNNKVGQTFLSVHNGKSVHNVTTDQGQTGMSDLPLPPDTESKICDLLSYSENPNPFNEVETQVLINTIDNCKILDPACGSGAFPMGILHKLVYCLHKLDPQNKLWKERQIEKVDRLIKDAGNINDSAIRDKVIADLENNKNDIEEAFENNELDYGRKLYLIENCIYGVDIQPIAVQISKLRFFISLIVDQKVNHQKENFGIRALPNLETKFVAANTLIGLDKPQQISLHNPETDKLEDELKDLRHQYFSAKTRREKLDCQKKDKGLREKISLLLVKDGWDNESAKQLSAFDPYDQNTGSTWFDAVWMFGIKVEQAFLPVHNGQTGQTGQTRMSDPPSSGGFDIVIGNPPYGGEYSAEYKKYFQKNYESAKTISGKQKGSVDTFSLFIDKGLTLANNKSVLSYIVPMAIASSESMTALHNMMFKTCETIYLSTYSNRPKKIFDSADQRVAIIICHKNNKPLKKLFTTKVNKRYNDTTIDEVIRNLEYVNSLPYVKYGRLPKVGTLIELSILKTLYKSKTTLADLYEKNGKPVYYRSSGGRYYNIITNFPTGSTKEKSIIVKSQYRDFVSAILSSNLYYWFYHIYSNHLDLKSYELNMFPIPIENFTKESVVNIEKIYDEYLEDLHKNSKVKQVRYAHVSEYREYYARYSKHLIDKIDLEIREPYGFTDEEIHFIINYDIEFRTSNEE